jgi:hypothetical protein
MNKELLNLLSCHFILFILDYCVSTVKEQSKQLIDSLDDHSPCPVVSLSRRLLRFNALLLRTLHSLETCEHRRVNIAFVKVGFLDSLYSPLVFTFLILQLFSFLLSGSSFRLVFFAFLRSFSFLVFLAFDFFLFYNKRQVLL